MKAHAPLTMALLMLAGAQASAVSVSDTPYDLAAIHTNGFEAPTEFYAAGNGQTDFPQFAEYGIAGFNFTAAEFGGPVIDIASVELALTHDNRFFTDTVSGLVRFYFSTDDFPQPTGPGVENGDSYYAVPPILAYDGSGTNDPDGVNPAEYASLVDLGTYPYSVEASGTVTTYSLDLSLIEPSLIDEINTGSNFQILIASPDLNADITFAGLDLVRDNVALAAPQLTITLVPEPAGVAMVTAACVAVAARRRR